jgi:hypothetical protein
MSTTSRVFPVLQALHDLYEANLPDTVTVYPGKYVTAPDGDFLTVGWQPAGGPAVAGRQLVDGDTKYAPINENFAVHCYLETMIGDTDPASILDRQSRLNDLWSQIQTLHFNNRQIGETVLGTASGSAGSAEILDFEFTPDETASGFVAGVAYSVGVEAWFNWYSTP